MDNIESEECDYYLSKDEIEDLREDFKSAMLEVRDMFTREDKRKYVEGVGEYRPKYLLTREQVHKIGELSLRKYAETKPTDFKLEDFIHLL